MPARPHTIILTKLHPPVTLGAAVARQRLITRLDVESQCKITLVQSPAGFGKTTLLAQWRQALSHPSAWLSLDSDDAEPARFLKYLIAALQSTDLVSGDEAARCLDGGGRLLAHDVIGCLINEIVELQEHLVLFLDDYHLVDTPAISGIVQDLINFSPANFHLVLASRTTPSLHIANLRARAGIAEITEADMRFNAEEAAGFFVDLRGFDLSSQEVLALHSKTEGWIAGLQLTTLSLRDPRHRQSFIESFSGNIREVADYLAVEVLSQQDESTQHFLLKTAVLERINAEVAAALTGRDDSQIMLETLEAENLFLVPLDSVRGWYRYHHLFREFLLARLRRDFAADVDGLFRTASRWFLQAGFTEEAVNYALDTEDGVYAAGLVEHHAMGLIHDGRLPQVERWIRKVPQAVYQRRFRLRIYHCWALMHMGFWRETDAILDETEKQLHDNEHRGDSLSAAEVALVSAEIGVLRLANAVISDNMEKAAVLGAEPLPEQQEYAFSAGTQANAMGFLCLVRSELPEAIAWGQKALVRHRRSGSVYGQVYARCLLGLCLITRGSLHAALEQMDKAEQLVVSELGNHAFSVAMVDVLKAVILYEWNQLARARELLVGSLPLVEECASLEIRNLAFIVLARIEQVHGHSAGALEFQQRGLSACRESLLDRTRARLAYERMRLLLARGEADTALAEARDLGLYTGAAVAPPDRWELVAFFRYLTHSRLALVEGKPELATAVLPRLQVLTRKSAREMMALEVGLVLAQAYFQAGERQRAYACALDVLEASQREGYLRLFLDEGRGAEPLWRGLLSSLEQEPADGGRTASDARPVGNNLRRILLALHPTADHQPGAEVQVGRAAAAGDLPEALSSRELGVLAQMAKGLSNKQIAAHLSVSVNTIRWHVSNILTKLGAQNRTEAVAKAQELGLIH